MTDNRQVVLGICVLLGLLAGIQGVAAYQTGYDKAENTVRVGNIETSIGEEFPSPTPVTPDEDSKIQKKIWVTNSPSAQNRTSVNCYIRIAVGYSNSDIGKAVSMADQDTDNWVYHDDGFYYYKKTVHEGESTTPLCSGFLIEKDKIEKTYWEQLGNFEIQIYEESIEADQFADFREAWDFYENA